MTIPEKQEFELEQPWIVNFKFVVEGVAQASVGFVGMIGKNFFTPIVLLCMYVYIFLLYFWEVEEFHKLMMGLCCDLPISVYVINT